MARPDFSLLWAKNNTPDPIVPADFEAGWSFIGSEPPLVDQFDYFQRTINEQTNWLGSQIPTESGAIVKTFDSLSDVVAATDLFVGQKVRVLGRYSPGDGGGNDYEIVAAATGVDDGGSFIDLSGSGFQAKGLFPNGVFAEQFGVKPDGTESYAEILAAFNYCRENSLSLNFGEGVFNSGSNNMPFKNPAFPAVDLYDCNDITIRGSGPSTIFKTVSAAGADVILAYAAKNLHFENFSVEADLTGFNDAGSNGLSVVGGWDNITFNNIWLNNLPYVDKASYLDGGKALTFQSVTGLPLGTVRGRNIYAKGCVYGAGLEVDLVHLSGQKNAIDVEIVAEDCNQGVIFSAGAATGALPAGMTAGFKVNAQLINCQQNVISARAHGVEIDAQIITTKTAAQRRLNPQGGTWNSIDSTVLGLACAYAKNSRISVTGDIKDCDYKAKIGGISAGASGQGGGTSDCDIYIDLGGAGVDDVLAEDVGGAIVNNSNLFFSTVTLSGALPAAFYGSTYNNTVVNGPAQKLLNPAVQSLGFAYDNGQDVYTELVRDGVGVFAKQTLGSSPDFVNFGVKDQTDGKVFTVRNDGGIGLNLVTANSVSTVVKAIPVYDTANNFVGYTPVYSTFG